MEVLCVDVGYSSTRLGYWDGSNLSGYKKLPTPNRKDADAQGLSPEDLQRRWMRLLASSIKGAIGTREIARVGVSFAGVVSSTGDLHRCNSIWGEALHDLSIDVIGEEAGVRCFAVNDLTAACYRYALDSRYTKYEKILAISISSGIGAKTFVRSAGGVVVEQKGRNGEIGFVVVDESTDAYATRAGLHRGTLGQYAAGIGFSKLIRDRATGALEREFRVSPLFEILSEQRESIETVSRQNLNIAAVAALASGDVFVDRVLSESIEKLARALHTIILYDSPDLIVLCGGFATAIGERYSQILTGMLCDKFSFLYEVDEIRQMIRMGESDDLDNLIGVGCLVSSKFL